MSSHRSTALLGFESHESTHLLSAREVAQLLGVHPKTLPTLIRRDGLPCLWVGRRRRFDRSEVNRWLSERKES